MARDAELRAHITVKDDASKDIDGLMKKVALLEKDTATILLTSNATKIAADIAGLIGDIDELDANDVTIEAKATQINDLKGDLDKIEAKIREVNSVPVDVDTTRATKGIDDVGKSLDGAKSVSANAIGNITQDLGSLGGVAGSAGVAIGQMGEYMADAAGSGEGLASVVKNFATVAGPLTVATIAVGLLSQEFQKFQKAAAETKAFRRERVDAFVDALHDAKVTAEELQKVLESGGKGPGIFIRVADETRNADVAVSKLFGSLENFNSEIAKGLPGYDAWAAKQLAVAEAAGATDDQMIHLKTVLDDARDGAVNSTAAAVAHAAGLDTVQAAAVAYASSIADAGDATDRAAFEARFYGTEVDKAGEATAAAAGEQSHMEQMLGATERATRDLATQWDILSGKLDTEQAIANIGSDFDNMREKGALAWDATAKGADDAKAKQDDYAAAVLTAKQNVVDLGKQIGLSIPEVKAMLLQIDDGEIDDVERKLNIMARNRTMNLSIVASGGSAYTTTGAGGIQGPRSVTPAPPAGPSTTAFGVAPMTTATTSTSAAAPIVVPVVFQLPTAASVARRIGPVRIPLFVQANLLADRRINGNL